MATSIQVTSLSTNNEFINKTYSDANPNASNYVLKTFAQKIGSLTNNSLVSVHRIDKEDITDAVQSPLKTYTWTANYFNSAKVWKQDWIYPSTVTVANATSGVSITSATIDGDNAVFELSDESTATYSASTIAFAITAGDKTLSLTYGEMVTVANDSSPGAKFAELLTQKLATQDYNMVIEYDATNGAYIFKNYVESSVDFSILSTGAGNYVNRWLYEEYNGTYQTGFTITQNSGPRGATYMSTIDV